MSLFLLNMFYIVFVSLAACSHVADVIFVLDSSGSIERDNFFLMQEFLRDVIYGIDIDGGSRVGLIQYSDEAYVSSLITVEAAVFM